MAYKIVPGLQAGDKVELFVDGARRGGMNVEGLVRGQHTVRIQAVNDAGEVQISSPAVTFICTISPRRVRHLAFK